MFLLYLNINVSFTAPLFGGISAVLFNVKYVTDSIRGMLVCEGYYVHKNVMEIYC